MKIAINRCYGGFSLSQRACARLRCKSYDYADPNDPKDRRDDPKLISCLEALGPDADGALSKLVVCDVPDTITDWAVIDYDGLETLLYVQDGKIFYTKGED